MPQIRKRARRHVGQLSRAAARSGRRMRRALSGPDPNRNVIAGQVFICGCGHSGTSLIANMFAAHPEVYVPLRETRVFKHPRRAQRRHRNLIDEAEATGRRFLVEKTPSHLHRMEVIRSLVPDARFVIPVRDGRDVVASIAGRSGSVQEGIARWKRDTGVIREQSERADVFTYRHEDLIEDPRRVLEAACAFVGIPFTSACSSTTARRAAGTACDR